MIYVHSKGSDLISQSAAPSATCLNEGLFSLVLMSDFSCNTILHLADASACDPLSCYHTSIGSIEFNAKISIRSTGIMAGGEDDATDGFVFPDHT